MDGAELNTTDLIGAWSMDGTRESLDGCFGSPLDAPAVATAEQARLCGTAYDVPILVKSPEDQSWRPLGRTEEQPGGGASDLASRLNGY
jgi:hypothetical protein